MRKGIVPLTRLFPIVLIFASSSFLYAQADSIYRLPAGTKLKLAFREELRSGVSSVGDTFLAELAENVTRDGEVVLPAGTLFEGEIVAAQGAKRGGRGGKLTFTLGHLLVGSDIRRSINAKVLTTFRPEAEPIPRAAAIVGGTAVGALIGFAAGRPNGALLGAGIGAGVSSGAILLQKGREVRLKKGQKFVIELEDDLILPVLDY